MEQLVAGRAPFVTATVIHATSPTSVRPGDSAIVLADGTVDGFVGGVCAESSVRLYSLRALDTGEAVLLRLVPCGDTRDDTDPGPHTRDDSSLVASPPVARPGAPQ